MSRNDNLQRSLRSTWHPLLLGGLVCLALTTHAEVPRLAAEALSRHGADEAGQGATADGENYYAIVNSAIGQYERDSGTLSGRLSLPRGGPIRHINSCLVDFNRANLMCANSNFSELPMASSIEVFDTRSMEHIASHSLGLTDGSLVWFDHLDESGLRGEWIAGFAHYDGKGGTEDRDHRSTRIVRMDAQWRELGGWMLPDSVLERLAPHSASGGSMGADGLLYLLGHDRKEMYVLALPEIGPKMEHVATIDVDLEGQAFTWDRSTEERIVWGISRPNREVRAFRIPDIPGRDDRGHRQEMD